MTLPCQKSAVLFVTWQDAVGESTRYQLDDAKKLQLATNCNVGWIVHEDETRIVLAHGMSTTGELDVYCIPRVNVIDMVPIVGKGSKKKPVDTATPVEGATVPKAETTEQSL